MKTLREEIAELIQPVWSDPEKRAKITALVNKYWTPEDLLSFDICYRGDLCEGQDEDEFNNFIDELKKIVNGVDESDVNNLKEERESEEELTLLQEVCKITAPMYREKKNKIQNLMAWMGYGPLDWAEWKWLTRSDLSESRIKEFDELLEKLREIAAC